MGLEILVDKNPIFLFCTFIFVAILVGGVFFYIVKDIKQKRKTSAIKSVQKRSLEVLNMPDSGIERLIEEGRIDEAVDVYRTVTGIDEYAARDAIARLREQKKR